MAGKDIPQSLLERLRPKLILAFQFNLRHLANLMQREGFLSDSDHQTVTAVVSVHNDSDKAGIMVQSLINKVEIHSKNYQTFLKLVQRQQRKFNDVVDLLAPGLATVPDRSIPSNPLVIVRSVSPKQTATISSGNMAISQGPSPLSQLSASSSSMASAFSSSTTTNTPISFSNQTASPAPSSASFVPTFSTSNALSLSMTTSGQQPQGQIQQITSQLPLQIQQQQQMSNVMQQPQQQQQQQQPQIGGALQLNQGIMQQQQQQQQGTVSSKKELIHSAIKKLEKKFSDLQCILLQELKDNKKSVDYLTTRISCLQPDINRYVYRSWKKIVKNNFENLNELFTDLNATVWTILDHYLLEYFIDDFGSEQLKIDMKVYSTELKMFKEKTLVSDFISCYKKAQKDRDIPDFEKMITKFDKDDATLADLDKYRENFKTDYFPSLIDCVSVIYFGKIQTGCLVFTLNIPSELAADLLNKKLTECQLFDDFKVIHIFVGIIKVYENSDLIEVGVKFTNAYRHFINTKDVLELLFLKILFSGPPRQGKTSARRRLQGEIVDLMSAGEADLVQPSTGAVESEPSVIVKLVSRTTVYPMWHAVKSLEEEAGMLLHNLAGEMTTKNAPTTTPDSAKDVRPVEVVGAEEGTAVTPTIASPEVIQRPQSGFFNKMFSKLKSLRLKQPMKSQPSDNPEIIHLFEEAFECPVYWEDVKHSFRTYTQVEDTGRHPELMDMLPALALGPALCLVFFNLEWNLKKEFPVFYQHSSGKTTAIEKSNITLEEMLLSTLSSISCSCATSADSLRGEEANSSDMREILESPKSVAYFVGTHKDKVTEEEISKIDSDLQSIIRGTDFFEKGIVQFSSEGKLIVAMDNMTGGIEEVNQVRNILHTAMKKHFKKLRIPAVWLNLNQCLQMREKRTASFESCLELSTQFNMSPYETKVALWFLHHQAGILMYFPDIPLLADLVILDSQVVYDSVTILILEAMSFDSVGQARAEKFKKTGQFVMKDLVAATNNVSVDIIPPEKLVALLEFLHMVAPIPPIQDSVSSTDEEQERVYLMPCVLHTASKEKLDAALTDQSRSECVAPLMIRYKCGFVPLGIFPALIASLIGNKAFDLVKRDMMKNKIQFYFGTLQITFLCYPKFYAIVISELPIVEHELHEKCVALRKAVAASLEQVNSHMNYGFFLDYQLAFECPSHLGREHLCVVEGALENVRILKCLQDSNDKKPVKMDYAHNVWFHKTTPHSHGSVTTLKSSNSSTSGLQCDEIMHLFGEEFPSSNAMELGTYLNISHVRLQDFSHNNMGNVEGMMIDVLSYWLETDPRKSWTKLAEAVEDCGYGVLADKIRSGQQ